MKTTSRQQRQRLHVRLVAAVAAVSPVDHLNNLDETKYTNRLSLKISQNKNDSNAKRPVEPGHL